MVKAVLQSIAGVEIYPIISLVLFLAAFTMILLRVVCYSKGEIRRFSLLPLDDDRSENIQSGSPEDFHNRERK